MNEVKTEVIERIITSEQAFDMLPYAVDIYEKLDMGGYGKKIKAKNAKAKVKKGALELGEDMVKYVVRSSGKIKKEIFEIVAIAEEKKLEEVKKQSLGKTLKIFNAIYKDKELVDFFKSAM